MKGEGEKEKKNVVSRFSEEEQWDPKVTYVINSGPIAVTVFR